MEGTSLAAHPQDDLGDEEVGRYRLDVIALDVADATRFAGGLICDRSMAGWDVFVLAGGEQRSVALRILGANPVTELPAPAARPRQTLAVSAAAIAADETVRARVLDCIAGRSVDVLVWDAQRAASVPAVFDAVAHEVSAAARAYKREALRALEIDSDSGLAEVFSRTSDRPVTADGVTAHGAPVPHRLGHGG